MILDTHVERLVNWLFWQFQQRCKHDEPDVATDILEGAAISHDGQKGLEVEWCHRCGAYRIQYVHRLKQPFRTPRATWTGPGR